MLAVALAGLLALPPWETAVAGHLACGTFEAQFHEDDDQSGCPESALCRDADGRPLLEEQEIFDTAGGNFRIHFTRRGSNAVVSPDRDGNGLPDFVDKVAAALDESLALFRELGFRDPQPDSFGGDKRVDIYLHRLAEFGGAAFWDIHSPNTRPEYPGGTPVFMVVNPHQHALAAELLPEWMGDLLIRQVVLHELHHAVQMGYGYGGASWVLEGMSVMMEQALLDVPRRFPFVTDFRYSLRFRFPYETLLQWDANRLGYANGLFYASLLMDMQGSPAGYVKYWDAIGRNSAPLPDAGPSALEQVGAGLQAAGLGTLREAYRRFTLREMFLGEYDDGRHIEDGYRYHPPRDSLFLQAIAQSGSYQTPALEPYGHAYFRIDHPASLQLVKPLTPDAEWDWVQQHADCTTTVTAIEPNAIFTQLPVEAGDYCGWLVVRHFGGTAKTYAFSITASVGTQPAITTQLQILEAPETVSTGTDFPLIARLTRSDCRWVDVTERAQWSASPGEGAGFHAAGGARLEQPGSVRISAAYDDAVSTVVVRAKGRPPVAPASSGGCAGGGPVPWWVTGLAAAFFLRKCMRLREAN